MTENLSDAQLEGNGLWSHVSQLLGNSRSAKQCRERWTNFLRPGLKKGEWTFEEEELIRDMYSTFGPR